VSIDLSGYNDVAARMIEFREKYPDGCLQPVDPSKPFEVVTVGDKVFIAYTAAAYRSPDDERPGIGVAWEPFPGRTNYTRDSELQNAETSAWGRAILAVGAADAKKGVASAEEVRNRRADQDEWDRGTPVAKPPTPEQVAKFDELMAELVAVTRRVDMAKVGQKAFAARAHTLITPAQFQALDGKAGEHIETLQQSEAAPVDASGAES
jgi:hypothetical protein